MPLETFQASRWTRGNFPVSRRLWFRRLEKRNRDEIMKMYGVLVLFLAGLLVARADDGTVTLPELVQGAQDWAQENLDTNVLNALSEVDERAVQQFFREVQQSFQGDYVVGRRPRTTYGTAARCVAACRNPARRRRSPRRPRPRPSWPWPWRQWRG